jgi:aminopeptidase-like protein
MKEIYSFFAPLETSRMERYFDRLWPICRSISGKGLRDSFAILQEIIPLELHEYPTGKSVFDWEIPKEWNIQDAYILTPDGRKIADFKKNNLHVVNYSIPINEEVDYDTLMSHLFTLEKQPSAIPYITSYYKETWGFCLDYTTVQSLPKEGKYRVVIESNLSPGSITVGSLVIPGESEDEILLSTYLCHPSMANNELSGPLTMAFLYEQIMAIPKRRYTYRLVMAPETIGVIAYLSDHGVTMKERTKAGFVLTCTGDDAPFTFKQSKNPHGELERVTHHVLQHQEIPFHIIPFAVGGSDERQYCSPGFNLPVGSITRSMYHRYPQYHTSLDNKSFISFAAMRNTVGLYLKVLHALERNAKPVCTVPFGEPRMGKRNLLPSSIVPNDPRRQAMDRMMHLICWSDGEHDMISIAEKRHEDVALYWEIVDKLVEENLLVLT